MEYFINNKKQILKKFPKNLKIKLPSNYKKISKELYYHYLINKQYNEEKDIVKLLEINNNQPNLFFNSLYYYYYPNWVKSLIKNGKYSFMWFKLNDFQFKLNCSEKDLFEDFRNPFLKSLPLLAEDIVNNGMYFPFIFYPCQNNCYKVRLGSHRLYALLQLNQTQFIEKEFLGIILPPEYSENNFNTESLDCSSKEEMPCYIIGHQPWALYSQNSMNNSYNFEYFAIFSDILAPNLFPFKDTIKPNLIWNNKNDFNRWLFE